MYTLHQIEWYEKKYRSSWIWQKSTLVHIYGLVQERRKSRNYISKALELRLSCTNLSWLYIPN